MNPGLTLFSQTDCSGPKSCDHPVVMDDHGIETTMFFDLGIPHDFANLHTQMLHGAGIFTNIETPKLSPSYVGKYSSTMEHLGYYIYAYLCGFHSHGGIP